MTSGVELRLTDFKCFEDLALDLGRWRVLVGPNGCGKSSVLEALRYLGAVQEGITAAEKTQKVEDLVAPLQGVDWSALGRVAGQAVGLSLDSAAGGPQISGRGPGTFNVSWSFSGVGRLPWRVDVSPQTGFGFPLGDFMANAPRFAVVDLTLAPLALGEPSRPVPDSQRLGPAYAGLASILANQLARDPQEVDALVDDLAPLHIPIRKLRTRAVELEITETDTINVDGALFPRSQLRRRVHHVIEATTLGGARVEGRHLSAGTLTAIALLLAVRQLRADAAVPVYVLIDELGRDLHPKAQHALVGQLRGLAEQHPNLRFVVTTHSPFVVDAFQLDEVRIMSLDDRGLTRVSGLEAHEHWAKWRDTMLPGEFWTWAGESWVARHERG